MSGDSFLEILDMLNSMESEDGLPKSVKIRIKNTITCLNNEEIGYNLRVDRSLEKLGDIAEDPNVPNYTRTQILALVSLLESRE